VSGRALASGDRQAFYTALSRTMQEYLAAKLDLPPGGIDAETVAQRGVSEDCVRRIRDFLTTCEQVRFAPAAGDGDMRGTLALAQEVIKSLERNRRLTLRPLPPGEGWGAGSAARSSTYIVLILLAAALATAQSGVHGAEVGQRDGEPVVVSGRP